MTGLPGNIKEVISIATEFFSEYGLNFSSSYWYFYKNILILKQSDSIKHFTFIPEDKNLLYFISNLSKILPNFSLSDIIGYSNGDVGIIFRNISIEEKISELPIELYVNIAKDLTKYEIENLCITNKQFQSLSKDNEFWRKLLLTNLGGNPPRSEIYDYLKIYKQLLIKVNKSILYNNMNIIRYYRLNLLVEAKLSIDLLIYLFNNDKDFQEDILNNPEKNSCMLMCLVVTRHIDEAKTFISFLKSFKTGKNLISESKIINILLSSYFQDSRTNHNYDIINFLFSEYPRDVNEQLINFCGMVTNLSNEDIIR